MQIDGVAVERECRPGSPEELSEILRRESPAETVMIPVGGGTRLHLGNPPRAAHLAVHTTALRRVVEYEPDNMTVSVLAGTPLAELQEVLRTGNQFLPIDPPNPARSTLGGIVASNGSGPVRFRYGTIRDMLIGVKIVHADGTPTKAGGKLVKNVTGYDMCKLYTGSLGTLGILSELTFKVQPLAERLSTVFVGYSSARQALEATQLFLNSELLPDALELWNHLAFRTLPDAIGKPAAPWILMVRFGEVEAAVAWQVARMKDLVGGTGGTIADVLEGDGSDVFWARASSARDSEASGDIAVKCSVLYRSAAETVRRMQETGERLGAETMIFCHAGNYVLYGRYRRANNHAVTHEQVHAALTDLRAYCRTAGGHAVIEKLPPALKNGLDVWGYDAPALEIMRRIKAEFDPKGLLNPGRFVGGI